MKEQNRKKKESINEYIEKIKQERMGVKSDDKGNLFERRKKINEEIKTLNEEINKIEEDIIPIRNKFNLLSDKVKTYEKYHLPNHLNKLFHLYRLQNLFKAVLQKDEMNLYRQLLTMLAGAAIF